MNKIDWLNRNLVKFNDIHDNGLGDVCLQILGICTSKGFDFFLPQDHSINLWVVSTILKLSSLKCLGALKKTCLIAPSKLYVNYGKILSFLFLFGHCTFFLVPSSEETSFWPPSMVYLIQSELKNWGESCLDIWAAFESPDILDMAHLNGF